MYMWKPDLAFDSQAQKTHDVCCSTFLCMYLVVDWITSLSLQIPDVCLLPLTVHPLESERHKYVACPMSRKSG